MSVSVLILTLNEEANLPSCLESVSWCDDVVVLDSVSKDRTQDIARSNGARVVERPFDDWSTHQNWAVENIDFKHRWVYYCDADEIVPPELADEIMAVTSDTSRREVCYRLRFKNMLFGQWIKRSSMYPTWVARLWKVDKIRWQRGTNPIALVDGPEGRLKHHFLHYSFSKGMGPWFEKHNKYSQYEAVETVKELSRGKIDWSGLLRGDAYRQRFALKNLSFRLPCRPLFKFFFLYLLRGGFLEGRAGLTYCVLQAIYEEMIVAKVNEIRRRESGLST